MPAACGWAATPKPKSAGRSPEIDFQVRPASSLRYTPPWFCRYIRSGSAASRAILCTHWPNSGKRSGRKVAWMPVLDGSQLSPPSVLR